mgnify:CR=1 FL=1
MKPTALLGYAIENSSKNGAIILDTFGGSGSTLIAAEKTHRIGYLMEIDPKYCDVIVKRYIGFKQSLGQPVSVKKNGIPFEGFEAKNEQNEHYKKSDD